MLDCLSAFEHPAVFIYEIAVRSPESSNRLGVAFVEGFDKGFSCFGDLRDFGIGFRSSHSRHGAEGNAGKSQHERGWNHLHFVHFVSRLFRFMWGSKRLYVTSLRATHMLDFGPTSSRARRIVRSKHF